MKYKIRYLKTSEEFEIIVPDFLNEEEVLTVRISDYDLVQLLKTEIKNDLDDDTYNGIKLLRKNYVLSVSTLKLAKRQQHLRKLNRVESSWVTLAKKERNPRTETNEQRERLEYLRNNENQIIQNCLKHDWFNEFYSLEKSVHPGKHKKEIIEEWKQLKNKTS